MQGHYTLQRDEQGPGKLRLHMPPLFTSCVQHLPSSGAWLLPSAAPGVWLSARPSAD